MTITMTRKEVLGLLVLFIVYVLIGGAVFMALEAPLEEKMRVQLKDTRKKWEDRLLGTNHPNFTKGDMQKLVHHLAEARSKNLMDDYGNNTHLNWSFYNSFFFAITVVTTIGYGHLAPSTVSGRIFCVFYAMIGIPMTGILLAAIGDHFSKQLIKSLERAKKFHNSKVALTINAFTFLLPWFIVFIILPACIFMFIEQWTFLEGIYYCFISLATIGFGDYVAGNFYGDYIWIYKTGVIFWIIFGLGYLAMILNYISRAMRCKQIRRMERGLSLRINYTQEKVEKRLDDIHHLLQEFIAKKSRRKRKPLTGSLSFGKPNNPDSPTGSDDTESPQDKNVNAEVHLQRLIKLVEALRHETNIQNSYNQHHGTYLGQIETFDSSSSTHPLSTRRHSLPVSLPLVHINNGTETSAIKNRSQLGFHSSTHVYSSVTKHDMFPFLVGGFLGVPNGNGEISKCGYEDTAQRNHSTFEIESLRSTNP
ncbi:potassium channel subfamily K member 4-like [Limulus polyphemus]|uniref:Potassium channel subfamily K member 4-like n=1 Tax=Limulus polyphemus TaxID=6850 RepID=A0ABM1BY04_LIMPO|nr:potassium channel subfamily K member 4-like [Limulus polyphemus]